MRSTTFASLLATATALTPKAGKSPEGVAYNSTIIPALGFNTQGYFGLNVQNGDVILDFKFTGVSPKGLCCRGRHFRPYGHGKSCRTSLNSTEKNKDKVENCAVGDVSGHVDYINIDVDYNNNGGFPDAFLSLDPNSKSFVGNRAVVVSNGKEQRVACGTLMCVKGCDAKSGHGSNSTSSRTPNGSNNIIGANSTAHTPGLPGASSTPGSGPATASSLGSQLSSSFGALIIAFAAALL
ncbi:hypothetical protein DM02DRAFT_665481 [Periconia macrospinosa]|uniref:Superoxide dismutase copper/zinc binding domain-containing protein n=1 Tax=Periconia macrospinosa TaxID=97972 RepID=A0A2V1CWN7_9PLEO|nr:hypothetical protein DM02DRAFT_665481 [Periconia macrospinosa]